MRVKEEAAKQGLWRAFSLDPVIAQGLKYYFASLCLIWPVMALLMFGPYYQQNLDDRAQRVLLVLAVAYTTIAFFYYLLFSNRRMQPSRGYIIWRALKRLYRQNKGYFSNFSRTVALPKGKLYREEKVSVLFVFVKLFFLPLMLNFAFGTYDSIMEAVHFAPTGISLWSTTGFNEIFFPVCLGVLFLIDVSIYSFGYAFESRLLHNRVKSVEPTVLGWVVALVCYGAFGSLISRLLGTIPRDSVVFAVPWQTTAGQAAILVLMVIFVSASVALGTKASNLTNRGIVTWGPYRLVRHPAYVTKNLAWWIAIIPFFSVPTVLSLLGWNLIYVLRALTEERHLGKDPAYRAYCRKVRYRFIPKVV